MDKTQLKRHNLVFLSNNGKEFVLQSVKESKRYNEVTLKAVKALLCDVVEIPGIIRRGESFNNDLVAIGFVHYKRFDDNRLRIGSYTPLTFVKQIVSVYEVVNYQNNKRTDCMKTIAEIKQLASACGIEIGVLGSAGLELVTELPYTDENSDIDILVKPNSYEKLFDFYKKAKRLNMSINMDFELDLPNGYGIKLAEIFMNTKTVLGKGISDVVLLKKEEIIKYLR